LKWQNHHREFITDIEPADERYIEADAEAHKRVVELV
jgi:hypothetical protein